MDRLNVFEYRSARRFLLDAVEHEKKVNPRFSIRKWAKEMGMQNHALLVFMLQGKRSLTLRQVPQLAKGLKLSTPERVYFQALVQLESARSEEEKELIQSWFQDFSPGASYQVKEIDQYQVISHWIHMAILSRTFSKQGFRDINELVSRFKSRLSSVRFMPPSNDSRI